MGAVFRLEHANIMAYVTSRSFGPPRVPRRDLVEFLEMLAYQAREYLIPERGFERWPEQIAAVARESLSRLKEMPGAQDLPVVPPPAVGRLLENLQSEFSCYPLYALAVGNDNRLREVARELASAPMYGQLLVLIPEHRTSERNIEVLDPVPAFSGALHSAPDWPGFQFWTRTGASAFARLDEADELVRRLRVALYDAFPPPFELFPSSSSVDYVLREWSRRTARRYRRLLHLSDLHFGTADASENQALLDAELREVVQSVDRVVITGDLFNTPKKDYATLFTNFRNNITHLASGREPISITGNHDQRMIGLFGEDYKQVALIGSRKIVVDEQCEMVFVCFNSSESGRLLARGRITKSQFRQLGGDFRTLTAAKPELKAYLPIVLVHHHPFSFDVPPETLVQRALAAVGLGDEAFLAMVDAEDLHRWCLDWNIKTILHGHKHKARYMEREIAAGGSRINLTAIGCGSSLGAEGAPVSYNMLEWDPSKRRWIVSFLESVNGGAFKETVAAVSPHY